MVRGGGLPDLLDQHLQRAAVGMASSAATKPPNMPPIRLPIEAPISTAMNTSSGLIRTVLLMTTGFRTWFSIWV